jgi:hypothetical protein
VSGDQAAFPLSCCPLQCQPGECANNSDGLSKRELFAAMAMQGIMANQDRPLLSDTVAEFAVQVADDLIEELEATNAKG